MSSPKTPKINVNPTPRFYKDLKKMPAELQETVWDKLAIFEENPRHSSLRVKKMRGHDRIWELSVTEQYRVTFEWAKGKAKERIAILRRVGTHDILLAP